MREAGHALTNGLADRRSAQPAQPKPYTGARDQAEAVNVGREVPHRARTVAMGPR